MQTNAGFEIQSLDLPRREGEQDLAQCPSAMEQCPAHSQHVRQVEVAKAEERENVFNRLAARPSEI